MNNWTSRMRVVAVTGALAALFPVAATAQEAPSRPSGAAVQLGGVTSPGRAISLPNTGQGPTDDSAPPVAGVLLTVGGLSVMGAVARRARARRRIEAQR